MDRDHTVFFLCQGDKKDEPRVSIRARVCADCIEAAGVDRIITMDLHAPQVQGFFKKPVDHCMQNRCIANTFAGRTSSATTCRVSPDAGSAKRARNYATELNCSVAIGD